MAVMCSTRKERDIINITGIPCSTLSCHHFITSERSGVTPGMCLMQFGNCCSKPEEDLAQDGYRILLAQCSFNVLETSMTTGLPETHTNCICERHQLLYPSGASYAPRACVFCGKGLQYFLMMQYVKMYSRN